MSAKEIYDNLQEDIQRHMVEEFIKPQLRVDELIQEFDKQLMSKECQSLQWQVLQDVVSKIIENKAALTQMFEKYTDIQFKYYYDQHFIIKINTMKHPSFDGNPIAALF